jgi:hypothetical protein
MDTIKIENFNKEYPNKHFPSYKTLSTTETVGIIETVSAQLKMLPNSSSLELVEALRKKSSAIPDINAESDDFDLKSVFLKMEVSPMEQIFINWYRFDKIDAIGLNDLLTYFDDIWYPATDDIDIFDASFSWVISICYSGEVMILKFNKSFS